MRVGPARVLDGECAADERDDNYRDIDKEYRTPTVVLEQVSPDQGADACSERKNGCPDGDSLGTLFSVPECGGKDGKRRRHDGGPAQPHDGAHDNQSPRAGRERRPQGKDTEYHQPGLEHALPAEAVADSAHGEQCPGEDQRVGVNYPLQLAGAGMQVAGDGRQSEVEHRVVERDDQQGKRHEDEADPSQFVPFVLFVHVSVKLLQVRFRLDPGQIKKEPRPKPCSTVCWYSPDMNNNWLKQSCWRIFVYIYILPDMLFSDKFHRACRAPASMAVNSRTR